LVATPPLLSGVERFPPYPSATGPIVFPIRAAMSHGSDRMCHGDHTRPNYSRARRSPASRFSATAWRTASNRSGRASGAGISISVRRILAWGFSVTPQSLCGAVIVRLGLSRQPIRTAGSVVLQVSENPASGSLLDKNCETRARYLSKLRRRVAGLISRYMRPVACPSDLAKAPKSARKISAERSS
jgi:hypothetical protein